MFFDVFTIFQDLCYGLDNGNEESKIRPELLDIDNVEKDICLGLLGESAPVKRGVQPPASTRN